MNIPKISIITPSFNQGKFIEETILSVKNQDYSNIEHIVIDGGSTDETLSILKKYDHLKWISEPDKGQTHAINKGFRMAKGGILTWLNSDDYLLPGAVTAAAEALNKHSEVDFVYGNYEIIDSAGRHLLSKKTISFDRNVLIYGRALIAQPASFFRSSLIDRIGYLDTDYDFCMDIEFWIRAVINGIKFYRIDSTFAAQRLHYSAKTMTIRWKLEEQHRRILNKYGILGFRNFEKLNKALFSGLKFVYRSKAAIKRIIQHRDYRIFAATYTRKKAMERKV